jgi:hypothetical protein
MLLQKQNKNIKTFACVATRVKKHKKMLKALAFIFACTTLTIKGMLKKPEIKLKNLQTLPKLVTKT